MRPPPGFRVRRPQPADAGATAELIQAAEIPEIGEAETRADDVAAEWRELDPDLDAWLIESPTGTLSGCATVKRHRRARLGADCYVHPAFAGRGIGALLVWLTEARARELAQADPDGLQVLLYNGIAGTNIAAATLLESNGYRPARWFHRMVIQLHEPPPDVAVPADVEVRVVDLDREQRAFYEAAEESHRDHWDAVPEDFETWRKKHVEPDEADPTLWFVAVAGGRVVGAVECMWKAMGKGYVRWLGVLPAWRGQGVGLALLVRAFREFHSRGETAVFLHVDAESPTGATRLYERAGMTKAWTAVLFEKELRPGRSAVASPAP